MNKPHSLNKKKSYRKEQGQRKKNLKQISINFISSGNNKKRTNMNKKYKGN